MYLPVCHTLRWCLLRAGEENELATAPSIYLTARLFLCLVEKKLRYGWMIAALNNK